MKHSKIYPWVLVALLWVVALLNYMDRQMLATMKPAMMVDFVELQTAENFGRLMAIFMWVYAFMSPVSGIIADRLNRKWLIVISLFVWSSVTVAMGYAETFKQLYWLRALMGVSEAMYIPAALSLITDFHSNKTRSLAIGIHLTGLFMGQALGGFGATIAHHWNWKITFQTFGLIGVFYSFVLVLFLREYKNSKTELLKQNIVEKKLHVLKVFSVLFSNISYWIILFYFAVPFLPGWGTKNWLPTLFASTLNINMAQAGPLSTITTAVSSLFGVIIGGIISDRWARKNLRGRIYTSSLGLAMTIPSLLLLGFGHSFLHIVVAACVFGFGFGMFDVNNMPILCQFVAPKHRATAFGFMNLTGIMAGAFITDLLGKSADEGHLGQDFGIMACAVLAALVIQLIFLRPTVSDYVQED